MMRAALAYATRLGWPVFPLRPRSKDPLIAKRDGGNGHIDATTDPEQIRAWWQSCPTANVGIACDERSGLLVLDVDPRHGGDDELAELEATHGELPTTPIGLTGGAGTHYVLRRPLSVRFRGKLCEGVDVKANGYIVAPPSIHPSGRGYAWDAGAHPIETPLADPPAWVLQRVLSFERNDYGAPADDAARSFLARAFGHAGWLGSRIDSTRINALCPWENEHTSRSGSGGSVIFAARDGSGAGWFHCAHESHGRKTIHDVLAVLPPGAVQQAAADIAADLADAAYERAEREAIQAEGGAA